MITKRMKEKIKAIANGTYTPPEKDKVKLTFEVTEKQYKKYQRWRNAKKKKEGELYVGAIGGSYSFCFTPTGVGEIVTVQAADGDELDLTDYNTW
jgi:hypothetical protein